MQDFRDKVAVITGAASGIGKGLATRCVQEGMKVVLADIEEAALKRAASELMSGGADVLTVVTDVSNAESVQYLAQATLTRFNAVHVLFNNAGVAVGSWVWKNTVADWEWVLGVNLWGVVHGLHSFVPIMLEQQNECYPVNTSSLAGLVATPGLGVYKASKHAVISLSETLYLELEQLQSKIHVSVVCPMGVHTRIGDSARNRPMRNAESSVTDGDDPFDTELAQQHWQRVGRDALTPDQLAALIFAGMEENRFYILSDPASVALVERRMRDIVEGRNPSNAMALFV